MSALHTHPIQALTPSPWSRSGSADLSGFFETVGVKMAYALPSDSHVTFELEGEGGGIWTVVRQSNGAAVHSGRGRWADSVLRCSVNRFMDLVARKTDMVKALNEGAVRIEGDMGLLLRMMAT
ncbi:MAG: SCP2 sterol-binding domain-containing protein [Myxococcota bacterium]